jgi:hypothetical protein
MDSEVAYNLLKTNWDMEVNKHGKNADFLLALFKAFAPKMVKYGLLFALDILLQIMLGILIGLFIGYLMNDSLSDEVAWVVVTLIIVVAFSAVLTMHNAFNYCL